MIGVNPMAASVGDLLLRTRQLISSAQEGSSGTIVPLLLLALCCVHSALILPESMKQKRVGNEKQTEI